MPQTVRRLQWAGLTCEVIALALMFGHLAFGLWQHSWWYFAAVLLLQLCFMLVQLAVLRWKREHCCE